MTRSLRNKVDNSLESPTIQYGRDELIKFIQAISSEAERNNIKHNWSQVLQLMALLWKPRSTPKI